MLQKVKKEFLVSVDDGGELDIFVAELLKESGIKGIFYIPTNCDLSVEQIKALAKDFEIGGHTEHHYQDLKLLNDETLYNEINNNKIWLENIIGRKITKFCYPRGRYDERVKNAVKKAGYKEARITKVFCLDFPKDKFEIATSIHCCPIRPEYKGANWLELAKIAIKEVVKNGGRFELWLHSEEIMRYGEIEKLKKVLTFISKSVVI